MKRKNGITLIALVISIIILLILAGTSIAVLFGQKGLVEKVKESKIKTEIAKVTEEIELVVLDVKSEDISNSKKIELNQDFAERIKKKLFEKDENVEVQVEVHRIVIQYKGQKYVVNEEGNIEEFKGEEIINGSSNLWDFVPETGTIKSYKGTMEELLEDGTTIVIPNYIDNIPVKILGEGHTIFNSMEVNSTKLNDTKLKIANGIEKISKECFYSSHGYKGDLIIPNSVTIIENGAFKFFNGNGKLVLSKNLKEIGQEAFLSAKCTGDLYIQDKVEKIGESAFNSCDKMQGSLYIPASVKEMGNTIFVGCNFKGDLIVGVEKFPSNMEYFNTQTFEGNLILKDTVKEIGDYAFKVAYEGAFKGTLVIPDSVTSIGQQSFMHCNFSKVIISSSVNTIKKWPFIFCKNLTSVEFRGKVASNIEEGIFINCPKLGTHSIKVPKGQLESYKQAKSVSSLELTPLQVWFGYGEESRLEAFYEE